MLRFNSTTESLGRLIEGARFRPTPLRKHRAARGSRDMHTRLLASASGWVCVRAVQLEALRINNLTEKTADCNARTPLPAARCHDGRTSPAPGSMASRWASRAPSCIIIRRPVSLAPQSSWHRERRPPCTCGPLGDCSRTKGPQPMRRCSSRQITLTRLCQAP